jgi:hypothetical protein
VDTVVGLRFRYDRAIVEALKGLLRAAKPQVADPARNIHNAGGWLDYYYCWFVEEPVLPAVLELFRSAGYTPRWRELPGDIIAWLEETDPELAAAFRRLPSHVLELVAGVAGYWREQNVRPVRLPCGCWLGPCPCCGRWELVFDAARACRYGGGDHPLHYRVIKEWEAP